MLKSTFNYKIKILSSILFKKYSILNKMLMSNNKTHLNEGNSQASNSSGNIILHIFYTIILILNIIFDTLYTYIKLYLIKTIISINILCKLPRQPHILLQSL